MGVDPPNPVEVKLIDFPTAPEELDEVLETIQTWLNEVALETVTVHADARTYELHRAPGS
jgi:hypothetical protein